MQFSPEKIDALREQIKGTMSPYRFEHTAEVEKMAVRLGALYAPDKIDVLRVSALLHDITKEKTYEQHLEILQNANEKLSTLDKLSPKTLHAKSAVIVIKEKYPEFATAEVLSAVYKHTTADEKMTLCEMIIYLADYIDMSRKFDDCVRLRNYFWDRAPQNMGEPERLRHLYETLVLSFDMTVEALIKEGSIISEDTIKARNSIIAELKK